MRVAHAPGMLGTFSPPPISKLVPWCMSGSLTRGAIPGACTTRRFTYLVRGTCCGYKDWGYNIPSSSNLVATQGFMLAQLLHIAIFLTDSHYLPAKEALAISVWIGKTITSRQYDCWSLTCRWCSNYISALDLTPGFNGLGKENCKMTRETFSFWDSVRFILEVWR